MSINVINRRGETTPLKLETISDRLSKLANMEPRLSVSTDIIAVKTVASLVDKIKTSEIDMISANICSSLIIEDHEFDTMAARIMISDLHKNTTASLVKYAEELISYKYRGVDIEILHPKVVAFIKCYYQDLERVVDYNKDYLNNFFGAITLIKSYLLAYKYDNDVKITKERPQQMLLRVAIGINLSLINDDGHASKEVFDSIVETYQLLSDRYYTHATPTLFNAGTINHTLSSCYLLSIDDSLSNIYSRLTDISKISKFSGGVGVHMSQVRATGSVIASTIGRSEGLVPLMRVFNESTRYVSQGGGKRKGSTAVYLEPWHADIESAILSQKQQGAPERLCRDLFLALWVPDLFMKRLKEALKTKKTVMWSLMCPNECPRLTDTYGAEFEELYKSYEAEGRYRKQVSIKTLWDLIMATQIETGKPYMMYKDHVNRKSAQNNLGVIKSSNLCVHEDTKILTDKGYVRIADVADQTVKIWDTTQFIDAPVRKTGTDQKLLKVITDDGCELKCTEYHRFSVMTGSGPEIKKYKFVVKEAQELEVGDVLMRSEYPIIEGNASDDIKYPYTHGFYCGDGTNAYYEGTRKQALIDLYHGKNSLIDHIEYDHPLTYNEDSKRQRLVLHDDIAEKFVVPINATIENKLQWLAGFLDADGCINTATTKAQTLQAVSIHYQFLNDIKLMCNTLGLNPKVKLHRLASMRMMPDNKGLGELKEYYCKETYRLLFTCTDTYKLFKELGMKTHRLAFNGVKGKRECAQYVRIKAVEEVEGLHDTYCFRSPITEMGIFNGIPTRNCSEITIYSDEKNIGVCNLASVCLPKFVKKAGNEVVFDYVKLNEVMQKIVVNMNKVMDNNKYPLDQAKYSDDNNRPIGVGVQGLSDVFMMMKTPFDSPLAMDVNKKIFETMYYGALVASNKLAQRDGPYKTFSTSMTAAGMLQYDLWGVQPSDMWDWKSLKSDIQTTGLRNSLLMAQMPTAGTSIIMANSESVEPLQSNVFTRSTLSGRFQVVNRYLVNDLKEIGLWTKSIRNKIIQNDGSVANIEEIPQNIRDVYKTVFEYKLTSFIKMCADREAFICQSSSNNRYLKTPDVGVLTNMHLYSWKMGLKTSVYYLKVQQANTGKKLLEEESECLSCSA